MVKAHSEQQKEEWIYQIAHYKVIPRSFGKPDNAKHQKMCITYFINNIFAYFLHFLFEICKENFGKQVFRSNQFDCESDIHMAISNYGKERKLWVTALLQSYTTANPEVNYSWESGSWK